MGRRWTVKVSLCNYFPTLSLSTPTRGDQQCGQVKAPCTVANNVGVYSRSPLVISVWKLSTASRVTEDVKEGQPKTRWTVLFVPHAKISTVSAEHPVALNYSYSMTFICAILYSKSGSDNSRLLESCTHLVQLVIARL